MGCNVCLCTIEKASYKFIRKEVEKCYLDQIRLRYDIGGRRNREYAKELKVTLNRIRNDKDYALRQYKICFMSYFRKDGTILTYFPFRSIRMMCYMTLDLYSYEETLKFIKENKDKIELSEGVYEELKEFWSKKGNKFIQIM